MYITPEWCAVRSSPTHKVMNMLISEMEVYLSKIKLEHGDIPIMMPSIEYGTQVGYEHLCKCNIEERTKTILSDKIIELRITI